LRENDNNVGLCFLETDLSMTKLSNGPSSGSTMPPYSPPQWKGAQTLKQVHALNERCLELLAQLARSERSRSPVDLVNTHRAVWRALNAGARKRAARCPFLLVDVHFQREEWWH
jgi:hypothetical protein